MRGTEKLTNIRISKFLDAKDRQFLERWNQQVQQDNGGGYAKRVISTQLGATVVWSCGVGAAGREHLVLFHGARTCAMFLDLDNALGELKRLYQIHLVEVNGQPTLSDGNSPDISGNGYGRWAAEVLENLVPLTPVNVGGASLGGLICLKLCAYAPALVKKAVLLNPAGISAFSLLPTNLFMNLLPIFMPRRRTIGWFLDRVVFYRDKHLVSELARTQLIDYELHALTRFKDASQKPAKGMRTEELNAIHTAVYLILGARDLLFPHQKTAERARRDIPGLRHIYLVEDTGHGIETSKVAVSKIVEALADQVPVDFEQGAPEA